MLGHTMEVTIYGPPSWRPFGLKWILPLVNKLYEDIGQSIALSNEGEFDDIETKTRKRIEALFRYVTTILPFVVAVGGVGLGAFLLVYFGKCALAEDGLPVSECEPLGESADITRYVFGILSVTISPLPFFKKLHTFIRNLLPAYISSPKEVLQGALLGEGYNRKYFPKNTGFMGIVKTEAKYLLTS